MRVPAHNIKLQNLNIHTPLESVCEKVFFFRVDWIAHIQTYTAESGQKVVKAGKSRENSGCLYYSG